MTSAQGGSELGIWSCGAAHAALKIGVLQTEMSSKKVVKSKFKTDFPEAVVSGKERVSSRCGHVKNLFAHVY